MCVLDVTAVFVTQDLSSRSGEDCFTTFSAIDADFDGLCKPWSAPIPVLVMAAPFPVVTVDPLEGGDASAAEEAAPANPFAAV